MDFTNRSADFSADLFIRNNNWTICAEKLFGIFDSPLTYDNTIGGATHENY